MESWTWKRTLAVAGGVTAAAGFLCYLFHEDEVDYHVPEAECRKDAAGAKYYFKVTDEDGKGIGIRCGPSIHEKRTGQKLQAGDVFGVAEIIQAQAPHGIGYDPQKYLRLADGRGWVFTHTMCGKEIAEQVPFAEAVAQLDGDLAPPTPVPSAQDTAAIKCMAERMGMPPLSSEDMAAMVHGATASDRRPPPAQVMAAFNAMAERAGTPALSLEGLKSLAEDPALQAMYAAAVGVGSPAGQVKS